MSSALSGMVASNMVPDQSAPLARSSLIRLCSFFLHLNICKRALQNKLAEIFQLFAYLIILHAFLSSADFFQNQLFKKFFQQYHQSAKQFGSMSGLMLCQA